jgi:hypothetical protein
MAEGFLRAVLPVITHSFAHNPSVCPDDAAGWDASQEWGNAHNDDVGQASIRRGLLRLLAKILNTLPREYLLCFCSGDAPACERSSLLPAVAWCNSFLVFWSSSRERARRGCLLTVPASVGAVALEELVAPLPALLSDTPGPHSSEAVQIVRYGQAWAAGPNRARAAVN